MHFALLVIGERVDEVLRRHKDLADGSVRFDNAWLGGHWEDGIWLRNELVFPRDVYVKNDDNRRDMRDGHPSRCTSCRKIDADFDAMYSHLASGEEDLQKQFDDYVSGMPSGSMRDCIIGSSIKELPCAITEAIATMGNWFENVSGGTSWRSEWDSVVYGLIPSERITIVDCHRQG